MSVLHLLPTFDTGGLGSFGLNLIKSWPEKVRHMAIAPRYPATKPDLFGNYVGLCGAGSVAQVLKSAFMSPPVWGEALRTQLSFFMRGQLPSHVINYNFSDLVYNSFGVRAAKFEGTIISHVGTVLPDRKDVRLMVTSPHNYNTVHVPVSAAVGERLIQLGAKPAQVLRPIWNGTDLATYEAPPREKALVFGFTGRLPELPVKDWPILIEGFREAAIPGSVLKIAGDGPGRGRVHQLVNWTEFGKKGINVEFVGNLTPAQVPDFLSSLDVFVMAALPIEGFSNSMVEAFASRCFMLASDVPATREPFAYGGGEEFLAKDSKAMAQAMRALQSPEVRARNLAFVEKTRARLTAQRMAREYFELVPRA